MEAVWGLVGEGLVYLDPGIQGPDNWRWLLSTTGMQVAGGGSWEPRDPENYLGRLRRHKPRVDPLAVRYVEEALAAFNGRCYLATSVMLGVASERMVDLLAQSLVGALGESAGKLRQAVEDPRRSQANRLAELQKCLAPLRPNLPEHLRDKLTLDAVAELLRTTRNDAGHPTGSFVDEDTAYTHLHMAALYLQKMTDLEAHFRAEAEV